VSSGTSLYHVDLISGVFESVDSCAAEELNVKEKQIEEWMATNPDLLFTDDEAVMIIAQEKSGEALADLLAVDSQGNLIIIEIKRHWCDRSTVGQLLDYAARLSSWDYEAFNNRWKSYTGRTEGDLFEEFKDYVSNSSFAREDFLKTRRLYVLASEADDGLKRIIRWLKVENNMPIDFVPFALFKYENDVFLRIDKIDVEPISRLGMFNGDWFFNTNETNYIGAWRNMLERNVVAACLYGKAITKAKMDKPAKGDRIFAYLNGRGIIAVGRVTEDVSKPGQDIFNVNTNGDEYHREVEWLARVPKKNAIGISKVSSLGYNMPVRCTIGQWSDSEVAEKVLNLLREQEESSD